MLVSSEMVLFVLNNELKQEVEHRKRIAQEKEETAYIITLSELIINKSVKSSSFRMYH